MMREGWETTRQRLHRTAWVLGWVKKQHVPAQINALHQSLYVTETGLTTGRLNDGTEIAFHFALNRLDVHRADGTSTDHPLTDVTPAALAERLLARLGGREREAPFDTLDGDEMPLALAEDGAADAAAYAALLYDVFTGLARFRARQMPPWTPLVVWPHGFDLATIGYRTVGTTPGTTASMTVGMDEARDPHIAVGFSPGSPGIARPYLYAYASPAPAQPLPPEPPAVWHTVGWQGIVHPADTLTGPIDQAVESAARTHYTLLTAHRPAPTEA